MSNEFSCVTPTIRVNGSVRTDLVCLSVSDRGGITPGKAVFAEIGSSADISGPFALTDHPTAPLNYGQRVVVYDASTSHIFFHGWLMIRNDQGGPDKILWTAVDDKQLLKYMPVQGCLIRDRDGTLQFSARHVNRTNPDGLWNCTGIDIGGTIYPVFTHNAYRGLTYESPTESFDGTTLLDDGDYTAWTPRRYLMYLHLCMILIRESINPASMDVSAWSGLVADGPLDWELSSITGLVGYDPDDSSPDPLDRKLADITFQGDTALGALKKALGAAGTHDLSIRYDTTDITAGLSYVQFHPVGYTALGTGKTLSLQRGGDASAALGTVIDFNLCEDATGMVETVVVHGATINVEARMAWDGATGTSKLVPGWDEDDEAGFLRVIHGSTVASAGSNTYAQIPEISGVPSGSWVNCDGTSGTPLVYARSNEALALARAVFPTVFRAWQIKSENMATALQPGSHPSLNVPRPVYPEQLQFMLRDLSEGGGDFNWLSNKFPIRVEIEVDDRWTDVPKDIGVRVTGDGLIWLDGIAEGQNGRFYCCYEGNLLDWRHYKNEEITLRNIRINAAVPTDHRVMGFATDSTSPLDSALTDAVQGSVMKYVDSPNAYKHDMQVCSFPAANVKYYGGAGGTTQLSTYPSGLTRDLPPGSEEDHADYAAKRLLARARHVRRTSSWIQWGIRTGIRASDWLEKIYLEDGVSTVDYTIRSEIGSVVWDFLKQTTTVGGAIGEY